MRIASYLYAYPEFMYLALFAHVYRVLSPRIVSYLVSTRQICIRNSIVRVSVYLPLLVNGPGI